MSRFKVVIEDYGKAVYSQYFDTLDTWPVIHAANTTASEEFLKKAKEFNEAEANRLADILAAHRAKAPARDDDSSLN